MVVTNRNKAKGNKMHKNDNETLPPAFPTSTFQRSNSGEYVRQSVGDAKRKDVQKLLVD